MEASDPDSPAPQLTDRRAATRAVARAVGAAVALVFLYFVAPIGTADHRSVVLRATIAVVAMVGVVVLQTVAVMNSETPMLRAIESITVSLIWLLITAASVYLVISGADEAAFSEPLDHVDALYLSMMTMTTVGFGDIGTVSSAARIAVMIHMVLNVAVLGVAFRVVMDRARTGARRHRDGG